MKALDLISFFPLSLSLEILDRLVRLGLCQSNRSHQIKSHHNSHTRHHEYFFVSFFFIKKKNCTICADEKHFWQYRCVRRKSSKITARKIKIPFEYRRKKWISLFHPQIYSQIVQDKCSHKCFLGSSTETSIQLSGECECVGLLWFVMFILKNKQNTLLYNIKTASILNINVRQSYFNLWTKNEQAKNAQIHAHTNKKKRQGMTWNWSQNQYNKHEIKWIKQRLRKMDKREREKRQSRKKIERKRVCWFSWKIARKICWTIQLT